MAESINPSPSTYLVKTINGSRRVMLYYDPDIFKDTIILSASYLIGDDKSPWDEHYNTVHDEITDGTNFQNLEDITIAICPIPDNTEIKGSTRVKINNTETYYIPSDYDIDNVLVYSWEVNSNNVMIISSLNGKSINIIFNSIETVEIILTISNICGCKRIIKKTVYPGTFQRKLLILQNNY